MSDQGHSDSPREFDGPENAPRDGAIARAALTAAGAEALGSLAASFGHPELSVVVQGVAPFIGAVFERRQTRGSEAVALTLGEASRAGDLPPDELLAAVNRDDRTLALSGDVAQVSYETLYVPKLIMLGRCLAAGLTDEARVDEERLIVGAVRDLEAPHVSMLDAVHRRGTDQAMYGRTHQPKGTMRSAMEAAAAEMHLTIGLDAVVAVLLREGLVMTEAIVTGGPFGGATGDVVYRATDLGVEVLRRMEDAARSADEAG